MKKLSLTEAVEVFDLKSRHHAQIAAALKKLGEAATTEEDVRQESGLAFKWLARYAADFADYIVIVRQHGRKRRLWCGTPAFAAKLRAKCGL